MIIECSYCESQVDAKILAQHEEEDLENWAHYMISLVVCPVCNSALVGVQQYLQVGPEAWEWEKPVRVWPNPKQHLDFRIPYGVRDVLEEANICFKSKAYNACVVMCGKALECICLEYKTKEKVLHGGLRELLEKGIIDQKIFQWSEALRLHRNIGAHAGEQKISREDCSDLLDFTNAICDYTFALTGKFEDFMKRQAKKQVKNG
jgi:hypothetical protein